jgi:hypothetical protein
MYSKNVIDMPDNGELPVYPMTAIDEISSKTPDALYNGTAMADIIKSCIPAIKDPWCINSIDLDAILVAIKSSSGGNDLTLNSECPVCKEVSEYSVNLAGILSQLKSGDYDKELPINDLSIKFRPLTYKEMNEASLAQFEAQRIFVALDAEQNVEVKQKKMQDALKYLTDITMNILSKTIMYIKTPSAFVEENTFILDFLQNCDKNAFITIRDYNAELKAQNEVKPLKIKCIECQHEYEQQFTLNTSDFFG